MKKQDNSEDKKPEEEEKKKQEEEEENPEEEKKKKKEGDNDMEERFERLESNVDKILKNMAVTKEEEDEEEKKKEDDDDEEEKKKEEEEDEEEKKKEEGEPKPGEGEVKLPKASAGETDEDAPPVTDKLQLTEKSVGDIVKKNMQDVLKSYGIKKSSTTPRPTHEIAKTKKEENEDFGYGMLKKVKEGKMSIAELNRKTKHHIRKSHNERVSQFLEKSRNKEVI